MTSSSKRKANKNIREINHRHSLSIPESDDRFICYDSFSKSISTIRKINDIKNIVRFVESIESFENAISSIYLADESIQLTTKQISELRLMHNSQKL